MYQASKQEYIPNVQTSRLGIKQVNRNSIYSKRSGYQTRYQTSKREFKIFQTSRLPD